MPSSMMHSLLFLLESISSDLDTLLSLLLSINHQEKYGPFERPNIYLYVPIVNLCVVYFFVERCVMKLDLTNL